MSDAVERARRFVAEEGAFRLGGLPTEGFHGKTGNLSGVAAEDLAEGIRLLQSVDEDIPPIARKVFDSAVYGELVDCFVATMKSGRRIVFTGCGATGRLSILLEAAWRGFWAEVKKEAPEVVSRVGDMEGMVYSVMAGGDFAL